MAFSSLRNFCIGVSVIIIIILSGCFWTLYHIDTVTYGEFNENVKYFPLQKLQKFNKTNGSYDCNLRTDWKLPSKLKKNTSANELILSPLFNRLIDDKFAIFCSSGYKPEGTGNALAIYWTARAMAFFMNWTFVMNENYNNINSNNLDVSCKRKRKFPMFDQIKHTRMKWTWFLQMEHNATLNTKCNGNTTKIASKYNQIWKYYANKKDRYLWSVPYGSHKHLFFLIYNPFFAQIIQSDTRAAFKRYYSFKPIANDSTPFADGYWIDTVHTNLDFHNSVIADLENTNLQLIVIHIRCSDLLFHGNRYLMNLQYFQLSLDEIFAHIGKEKAFKIQIISQLDASNVHTSKDLKALPLSNKLVFFMIAEIEKYIASKSGIDYQLEIIGNGTTDNDYFQMATARYLVCSPSSFCLMAAIANWYDPQLIILPQIGSWHHERKDYLKVAESASGGILSHHKWIDTHSLYKQIHQLFDTKNPTEANLDKFKKWFVKKQRITFESKLDNIIHGVWN